MPETWLIVALYATLTNKPRSVKRSRLLFFCLTIVVVIVAFDHL